HRGVPPRRPARQGRAAAAAEEGAARRLAGDHRRRRARHLVHHRLRRVGRRHRRGRAHRAHRGGGGAAVPVLHRVRAARRHRARLRHRAGAVLRGYPDVARPGRDPLGRPHRVHPGGGDRDHHSVHLLDRARHRFRLHLLRGDQAARRAHARRVADGGADRARLRRQVRPALNPLRPAVSAAETRTTARHTLLEDVQAMLAGCLIVALAISFLRESQLLAGGTTGLAFLIHYLGGWPLGAVLFVVNLPFYVFAWRAMGRMFTLKTFAAVALLSVFTELVPRLLVLGRLDPVFAAIMAGLLIGIGILILIRHGASLGGIGVMALHLQKTRGWRAGTVQ